LAVKFFERVPNWFKGTDAIVTGFSGSLSFFTRYAVALEVSGDTQAARKVLEQWAGAVDLLIGGSGRGQTLRQKWAENLGLDSKSSSPGRRRPSMTDEDVYKRVIPSICNIEPEAIAKMAGISEEFRSTLTRLIRGWLSGNWENIDREYGVPVAFLAFYALDEPELFKEAMQKISGFAEDIHMQSIPDILQVGYCYIFLGSLHAQEGEATLAQHAFEVAEKRIDELKDRGDRYSEIAYFVRASSLMLQGEHQQAIRVIEEAQVEWDPESEYFGFPIEGFLACCYSLSGVDERAKAQATKALKAEVGKIAASDERIRSIRTTQGKFNNCVFLRPFFLKAPEQVFGLYSQLLFNEDMPASERGVLISTLDALDTERLVRAIIEHFIGILDTPTSDAQAGLPNEERDLQLLEYLISTDTRYRIVIRLLIAEVLSDKELSVAALERTGGYVESMKRWQAQAKDYVIAVESLHGRGYVEEALGQIQQGLKLAKRTGKITVTASLAALQARVQQEVEELQAAYSEGNFQQALGLCEGILAVNPVHAFAAETQGNIHIFLEIKTHVESGNIADAIEVSSTLPAKKDRRIGRFTKRLDRLQKGLAAVDDTIAEGDFDKARRELTRVCGNIGFGINVAEDSTLARSYAQRIDRAEAQVKPVNFGGGTCKFDYLRTDLGQVAESLELGQNIDVSLSFAREGSAEETLILSGQVVATDTLEHYMRTGIGDIDRKISRFLKERENIIVFNANDMMIDDDSSIALADVAVIGIAQGPVKKAPFAIFLGDFREDPFAQLIALVYMLNGAGILSSDEILSHVNDAAISGHAYKQEIDAISARTGSDPSESIKCHYALVALQMQLHKDNPAWGESIEKFFSALELARGPGTEVFQTQGVLADIEANEIEITAGREDSAKRLSEEADRCLGGLLFIQAAEYKMEAIRLLFKAHWEYLDRRSPSDAARCLAEVAQLHSQLGSEELEAKTIGMAGGTLSYAREYARAAEYADKAIQLGKKGDQAALASNYMTAGAAYMRLGDYQKALSRLVSACSLYSSQVKDDVRNGKALALGAVCQKRLGHYKEAGDYDRMSAEVNEQAGERVGSDSWDGARWIAFAAEHYAYAAKNYKTARDRSSRKVDREQNMTDFRRCNDKTIALLRQLAEPVLRRDDFKSLRAAELPARVKELSRYLMQSHRCLLDSITVPELYEFAEILIRDNATITADVEAINTLIEAIASQA